MFVESFGQREAPQRCQSIGPCHDPESHQAMQDPFRHNCPDKISNLRERTMAGEPAMDAVERNEARAWFPETLRVPRFIPPSSPGTDHLSSSSLPIFPVCPPSITLMRLRVQGSMLVFAPAF